ncbi:hypothetical protein [Singulisphaera acidiphila]|uniref:hypothetical protein n=1 Tax=Singulisphaera acidiphila TaxID=466153 RepID=UPI0012B52653|nr:hypothetical protein [Singulisphaera acidiphila]
MTKVKAWSKAFVMERAEEVLGVKIEFDPNQGLILRDRHLTRAIGPFAFGTRRSHDGYDFGLRHPDPQGQRISNTL